MKKETHKCNYCDKLCKTVNPDSFDGLCVECATKSLYSENVHTIAKQNKRKNYDPIPIGKWVL